jgi:hypothetical protein
MSRYKPFYEGAPLASALSMGSVQRLLKPIYTRLYSLRRFEKNNQNVENLQDACNERVLMLQDRCKV